MKIYLVLLLILIFVLIFAIYNYVVISVLGIIVLYLIAFVAIEKGNKL